MKPQQFPARERMNVSRARRSRGVGAHAHVARRAAITAAVLIAFVLVRGLLGTSSRPTTGSTVARPDREREVSPSPPAPIARVSSACGAGVGTSAEIDGAVVRWGADNVVGDAEACCRLCEQTDGCNIWVWCADESGCGGERKFGECWLKKRIDAAVAMHAASQRGDRSRWTSGALFTAAEARAASEAIEKAESERMKRRNAKGNHHVYLDVSIDDDPSRRIEFILYTNISPLAAENFRRMCEGVPSAKHTWVGSKFYRILDKFIDQTGPEGVAGSAVNPGLSFDDDPGGLKLKHDRPGLLSLANSGPNTNTGHFSIVMAPAPHLDGSYVIFGEIISGLDHAWAVNALATESGAPRGTARITQAGVLATF